MSLERQLAELKFEVAELRALVEVQGQALRALLSERDSEFELVSELPRSDLRERAALSPRQGEPHSQPSQPSQPARSATTTAPALNHQEREEIAREVGRFLGRALRGEALGTSGRDRNPLRSRVYLACRDHTGRDIVPPAVYERFCDLASRCKRGGDCGQSVFVGLPSRWEARVALEAAGLATDNC